MDVIRDGSVRILYSTKCILKEEYRFLLWEDSIRKDRGTLHRVIMLGLHTERVPYFQVVVVYIVSIFRNGSFRSKTRDLIRNGEK